MGKSWKHYSKICLNGLRKLINNLWNLILVNSDSIKVDYFRFYCCGGILFTRRFRNINRTVSFLNSVKQRFGGAKIWVHRTREASDFFRLNSSSQKEKRITLLDPEHLLLRLFLCLFWLNRDILRYRTHTFFNQSSMRFMWTHLQTPLLKSTSERVFCFMSRQKTNRKWLKVWEVLNGLNKRGEFIFSINISENNLDDSWYGKLINIKGQRELIARLTKTVRLFLYDFNWFVM
jgi:hypothetical protein